MRLHVLTTILALLVLSWSPIALAQGTTRLRLDRGDVSGLEMSIEGVTDVAPGSTFRLLFTLYEVVGQRDLRSAAGASLRVLASFRRDRPVAEVETDAFGRAQVAVEVPADQERDIDVVIEAVSASRIRRRFQLEVNTLAPRRIALVAPREEVAPGELVQVVGQVTSAASGRPLGGQDVFVSVADDRGRLHVADRRFRTDALGLFSPSITAPDEVGTLWVRAWLEDHEAEAMQVVAVTPVARPDLVVLAVPERQVAAPGDAVAVEVVVRAPDGRPVAGAVVQGLRPPSREGSGDRDRTTARTDELGRARLLWEPEPGAGAGDPQDVESEVTAVRPGHGRGSALARVRLARHRFYVGVTPEGGGLVPGVPGRVFIHVVGADGRDAEPGQVVSLRSARLGNADGVVGQNGVVALDVRAPDTGGSAMTDRCGGGGAAAATVTVGNDTELDVCVPLDLDGTVRVRVSPLVARAGSDVTVDLERAAAVRSAPVVLTLLGRETDNLVPIHQQVVPAGVREVVLRVPEHTAGELLVRARPLFGPDLREVRGGTALVIVVPPGSFSLRAMLSDRLEARIEPVVENGGPGALRGLVTLVPHDETPEARLREAFPGALPAGGIEPSDRLGAELAARTPRDLAAPAVLRAGEAVDSAGPEGPAAEGILRDPWRARARFFSGRLALIIRAIEDFVASAVPERLDDVADRRRGRWTFNRELLDAVAESHTLGSEGARGLGGLPMSIEDLEALDPELTFDSVARRITRHRILRALLALRQLVRRRDLDLSWATRGDPAGWIAQLVGQSHGQGEPNIELHDLLDGWGRPFALRPAPGARPRFDRLVPVPGYELVSAGPDGRSGTADDIFDPTARVLRSGGVYAEAVGEDELLARLGGVELGRATARGLADILDVPLRDAPEPASGPPGEVDALPRPIPAPDDAVERTWIPAPPLVRRAPFIDLPASGASVPVTTGSEPRRYRAVVLAWSAAGGFSWTGLDVRGGVPLLLDAAIPARIGSGERVVVPVSLTSLPGGPVEVDLELSVRGDVDARLGDGSRSAERIRLGPDGTVATTLMLSADTPGRATVRLVARPVGEAASITVEREIGVDDGALLRSQVATTVLDRPRAGIRIDLPRDALDPRGEVVVIAPSALDRDPAAAWLAAADPALLAWFHAVRGAEVPERLRSATGRVTDDTGWVEGQVPELSTACAVVSVRGTGGGAPMTSLIHALNEWADAELGSEREEEEDTSAPLRRAASVLTATASGASGIGLERDDELSSLVDRLRRAVRTSLREHRGDPGLMARAAAALLLVDPGEARGRAMLDIARASLAPGLRGGSVVRATGEPYAGAEEVSATAALAIAARQVGDEALARELAMGLAARAHVAFEVGGEPAFWLLAAGAYGVFGVGDLDEVMIESGGASRVVRLDDGLARAPIDLPRAGRDAMVLLSSPSRPDDLLPLVRTSVRYGRRADALESGPLRATVEGDTGALGDTAALEITVVNVSSRPVDAPVLLVALPATGVIDAGARRAMQLADPVLRVDEPDARGVVRIGLARIAPDEQVVVPLPVRWIASGGTSGLSVAAFAGDRPWELSVALPRRVDVGPRVDR
jgi:hypothetical protein